jgi:hypothetical protein
MAKLTPTSIVLLLLWSISARSIEDHLRNTDTMDYMHMDCNHNLFNTYTKSTENATVYVNMCRMLPESSIDHAQLPADVIVVPSNVIIRKEIMGKQYYNFLNLSDNNGIELSSGKEPHARVYWRIDELKLDLFLELSYRPADTQSVRVSVTEKSPDTDPQSKERRIAESTTISLIYFKPIASITMDGVYYFNNTRIIIEIAIYSILGLLMLLPRDALNLDNRYSVQDAALYWLSINFLTDLVVQYFGEYLPLANFIVLMAMPTIFSLLLISKSVIDRINVKQNAVYFFYIMLIFNSLIMTIFVWTTMVRNGQYIVPALYTMVLPVVCRYIFMLGTSADTFQNLNLPFCVSLFLFMRMFQVYERIRGMLSRSVKSPLMGPYITPLYWYIPLMACVVVYQALYLVLVKYIQTYDIKIDDKYMSGVDDLNDNSSSKL